MASGDSGANGGSVTAKMIKGERIVPLISISPLTLIYQVNQIKVITLPYNATP